MKRIVLFLVTNLAVGLVLSITLSILGVNRYLAGSGLNVGGLAVFSVIVGFAGSFISLLMSKPMAKWSTGARVIEVGQSADELWLLDIVKKLADKAGVGTPEVGIYEGAPNAFATGAFRNDAFVAVSTGLLESMTRDEVEAVLGHEISHVANGDMVTLTLIQGVVNTFVIFLARVVGYLVDRAVFRTERGVGIGYYVTVFLCEMCSASPPRSSSRGSRASASTAPTRARRSCSARRARWSRRWRRLGGLEPGALPQAFQSHGITEGGSGIMALLASHPPIEARIAALESRRPS